MEIRLLYVTCANAEEARTIARTLVEAKLAACCNLIPGMESLYRWQGKIEDAHETILIAKTRANLVAAATAAIKEKHSYSVPGVIELPVLSGGNPDYLAWIAAETAAAS